jgi:hypothetical protein
MAKSAGIDSKTANAILDGRNTTTVEVMVSFWLWLDLPTDELVALLGDDILSMVELRSEDGERQSVSREYFDGLRDIEKTLTNLLYD